ncbi:MAG: sigma-54-dependent Fis family transcriptional regulator [Gammaproteobacteria bacterium]|nr:sigma-54-dependent Fis family transcriptional regulator [Gammaproteobacteria bacterium]
MTAATVLVVDDEPDIRSLVREILEDEGFRVAEAQNGAEARAQREQIRPDLILLDIWMPDIDGITLLKEWSSAGRPAPPVIIMSGHGTVETAVEATRLGAYDFLEKPLSTAKLLLTVRNALDAARLHQENVRLRQHAIIPAHDLIGRSDAMARLREHIRRVANHHTPVLIEGESGAEKESVARCIHEQSGRADGPFIKVSVSALSPEDATAEMFGFEDGGEVTPGCMERAEGGSLFLKDIADMDLATQARLQNAIEKQAYTRRGGATPVPLDVRLMAATRYRLDERVKDGSFRDDFFFQISVVPVRVPPLREHYEDIPELLDYYVNFFVEHEGLPYRRFSTAVQNRLRRYAWPGNIRELKNLVQRLLILGNSDTVELEEVEPALGDRSAAPREAGDSGNFDLPLREAREKFERAYLEHQLRQANGSVSKIARVVGMERTHLYRKLKSLGIDLKP